MIKRIAIVAGETSGDLLGARLIKALQIQNPDLVFEGIAGTEMQAAGCRSLYPMETLSVMGLVEVLKHLPELLKIRRELIKRWTQNPPDLFIGVDAPDFNLPLAKRLHAQGIKTVHYVSPSVWAWRQGRVKKMQGAIDLMLTLFPFEVEFYRRHQIKAVFVGHPLADEIVWDGDRSIARQTLGVATSGSKVIALLPGSRLGEIKRLLPTFLQAAQQLKQRHPECSFIIPAAHPKAQQLIQQLCLAQTPELDLIVIEGQSRTVMQAADYILLASGTAVLEGMLSGRLMVAAYQVAPLTAWLLRTFKLLKVKYVTLPNNLANERLVPELLQEQVTIENSVSEIEKLMALTPEERDYYLNQFQNLQQQLKQQASATAAAAIVQQFNL
ncbi:lipid-A-disaccharide synthase [Thiofilum flexile]|uniref:lipid-A-disaccharide synthase n=1 Tax=Thiofilum flexile TaxID=125627 RepID=UPI0003609A4B|nr:lipid-A-disaccharide synthase [Thiofilum flexile]